MTILVGGGGGVGPRGATGPDIPGLSSDGKTPGGAVIDGILAVNQNTNHNAYGLVVGNGAGEPAATIQGGVNYVDFEVGNGNTTATLQLNTNNTTAVLAAFRIFAGAGDIVDVYGDGSALLLRGWGMWGRATPASEPTVSQALITAVADANTKAALQAIVDALNASTVVHTVA